MSETCYRSHVRDEHTGPGEKPEAPNASDCCSPERVASVAPSPSAWVEMRELEECIDAVLRTLDPREEKVIRMHFGFPDGETSSLKKISQHIKHKKTGKTITPNMVGIIEAQALRKLRHPSRVVRLAAAAGIVRSHPALCEVEDCRRVGGYPCPNKRKVCFKHQVSSPDECLCRFCRGRRKSLEEQKRQLEQEAVAKARSAARFQEHMKRTLTIPPIGARSVWCYHIRPGAVWIPGFNIYSCRDDTFTFSGGAPLKARWAALCASCANPIDVFRGRHYTFGPWSENLTKRIEESRVTCGRCGAGAEMGLSRSRRSWLLPEEWVYLSDLLPGWDGPGWEGGVFPVCPSCRGQLRETVSRWIATEHTE